MQQSNEINAILQQGMEAIALVVRHINLINPVSDCVNDLKSQAIPNIPQVRYGTNLPAQ